MNRGGRKEAAKITLLVSDDNSVVGELCRHVKEFDDCKRLSDNSKNEKKLEVVS